MKSILKRMINFIFTRGKATSQPLVDSEGTIHVPAHRLPESSLLGHVSKSVVQAGKAISSAELCSRNCANIEDAKPTEIAEIRQCMAEHYYSTEKYKAMIARYQVAIESEYLNGVAVETITPSSGIGQKNHHRVLINLHGGAFVGGARTLSQMESVPIAALAGIKVVSIDYRMGPEHQFPAASEDAVKVYTALLNHYEPSNIGIYGCSAGAVLTSQVVSSLVDKQLPLPCAVGMFAAGAFYWNEGDSGQVRSAQLGITPTTPDTNAYLNTADMTDPLAFPGYSESVLAAFPPALLISSSRDFGLSSVLKTHSQLIKLGVKADLNIWEGLEHCFFYDPEIPESQEVYNVIVKFFEEKFGTEN